MRSSILIILCLFTYLSTYSQGSNFKYYSITAKGYKLNSCYSSYETCGEKVDGKKHGKWISMSADSIIYLSSEYDKGIPVGVWSINFPDGSPREKIHYTDNGTPVKWERFHLSQKMAELICPYGISEYNLNGILRYENLIFELQLKDFKSYVFNYDKDPFYSMRRYKDEDELPGYAYITSRTNPYTRLEQMIDRLKLFRISAQYSLWNTEGQLTKMFVIKSGEEVRKISNFYQNGKLKRQYIYIHGELKREITFNRKGKIRKQIHH